MNKNIWQHSLKAKIKGKMINIIRKIDLELKEDKKSKREDISERIEFKTDPNYL